MTAVSAPDSRHFYTLILSVSPGGLFYIHRFVYPQIQKKMNLNECCLFYEKAEWAELRLDHVPLPEMRRSET